MTGIDYSKRLNSLINRRNDIDLIKKSFVTGEQQILTESFQQLKESDTIKYVIGAMKPVDAKYTQITYQEGERVKNQLKKLSDKGIEVEFKYQGSVTNNTHIKAYSDIDILTIYLGFTTLEPPQKASYPYPGDPIDDLCKLRNESYTILRNAYPTAEVDNTGAKSISLKGGSLRRKVDVVPSNWYDTVKYTETQIDYYRGVMVLDYKNRNRIENTPFYHNKLLNDKDLITYGNFKNTVRLLKSLKADAEVNINLSSYDIAALMYNMSTSDFLVGKSPLVLIEKSLSYLKYVYNNDTYRNSLVVPDKSRKIFKDNGATKNDLYLIIIELANTYDDIVEELSKSGNSIAKQIVA